MKLRLPSKPSSGDTLAMVITALEVLEATSDAITAVPFLGVIVSAVLGLAKTLEVRH